MFVFKGENANTVWQMAMSEFNNGKNVHQQTGRNGLTKEILHAVFTIQNPRDRWVVARQPALNPAFAIAEVVWILSGRKDSPFLNYWNTQLPKYAGKGTEYHGAYGFRLRHHFGIDQLERAYLALKHNPDGRQVVLQIWDAGVDLPDNQGKPSNADIPCNLMSLLKVRNGKLEWMQINRSNDIFLGVPHNFIQFTFLQEVLAGWLNIEVGSYNHLSDSLHLYEEHAARLSVDSSVSLAPNVDVLTLSKKDSDMAFDLLNSHIEAMTRDGMTENDLIKLVATDDLNMAFKNLLLVNCAEAARRQGWIATAQDMIGNCTNPALVQVWNRWFARVHPL